MDRRITEQELARHLPETLDRVHVNGDRITIDRQGEPIAILAPAVEPVTWRKVAERLAEIGLPGEGFADDVEAAQRTQPMLEPPTWPS
jgi:antitoxin (DNA-binding transcriptional repressor) of toxin-antitoxin stability system